MPTTCSAVDLELAHYQSALTPMYTALHGYPDAKNCATTNISAASQRDTKSTYAVCVTHSSHIFHIHGPDTYYHTVFTTTRVHVLLSRKGIGSLFWAARYQPRSALPGAQGISFLAKPSKPWVTQSRLGASIRA
jgi:hypothetical protein